MSKNTNNPALETDFERATINPVNKTRIMAIIVLHKVPVFLIKLLSKILFKNVAWVSTPGYLLASGTVLISPRLVTVVPTKTILSLKFSFKNL